MRRRTLNKTMIDYSQCFKITSSSSFKIKFSGTTVNDILNTLQYSIDDGITWNIFPNNTYVSFNKNQIVIFKGNCKPKSIGGIGKFSSDYTHFVISGNIMSLLFGNNYLNKTDLTGYDYAFYNLFRDCSALDNINNLILPATKLSPCCYREMFYGCSGLTTLPSNLLPATTLARYCYNYMFSSCLKLTSIPSDLFTNSTMNVAEYCFSYMFSYCKKISSLPSNFLHIWTAKSYCCYNMFLKCTSLVTISNGFLNYVGLEEQCFAYMFQDCTSLTTVPSNLLPSTILVTRCYYSMFKGCSSLTTAPDLPATKLVSYCYGEMFRNCSSLNYIKAMFTTTPSTSYTSNWVNGVAASGTFVKNRVATWNVTGVNGIPDGWTVQTASS